MQRTLVLSNILLAQTSIISARLGDSIGLMLSALYTITRQSVCPSHGWISQKLYIYSVSPYGSPIHPSSFWR